MLISAGAPGRNGILIIAAGDEVGVFRQVILEMLPLIGDDLVGQGLAAAGDGALAPDDHIETVVALLVVHLAQVEQAGIAAHLGALKAAGDAGLVIHDLGSALQHGALVQIELHIAVQAQRTGQVGARRQIDRTAGAAGINGPLQSRGVLGHAVALGPVGGFGHVDALAFGAGAQHAGAHRLVFKHHVHPVFGLGFQIFQGKMGAVGGTGRFVVEVNGIFRLRAGSGRLIPVQHSMVRRAAGKQMTFKHFGIPLLCRSVVVLLDTVLLYHTKACAERRKNRQHFQRSFHWFWQGGSCRKQPSSWLHSTPTACR